MADATVLTPVVRGSARDGAALLSVRFDIPSVGTSATSPYYEVAAPIYGRIVRIKIFAAGTSTDYDVEFGDADNFVSKGVDSIAFVDGVTAAGVDNTGLNYYYVNRSETEESSIFVKVTNNDGSHTTGIITVDVMVANS